jgi:hypothetical protein
VRCPKCQFDNEEAAKFCGECGRKLAHSFPGCGHQVRPRAKLRNECGNPLPGSPQRPPPKALALPYGEVIDAAPKKAGRGLAPQLPTGAGLTRLGLDPIWSRHG